MRHGYNRVFVEGFLGDWRVTKHGIWFMLVIDGGRTGWSALDCGSFRALVVAGICGAGVGYRLLVCGRLGTKPTRLVVDDIIVLAQMERLPVVEPVVGVRAAPSDEYLVGSHPRTLRSGRIIVVKAHTRGKRRVGARPVREGVEPA